MAKRARMKGRDFYVVFCRSKDKCFEEWEAKGSRREADIYASKINKQNPKYMDIKKWICRVPHTYLYKNEVDAFIKVNYPHCVGGK